MLVGEGLEKAGAADWLAGLINDGIVAGVGAVLGFVPQMLVLFLLLAILEGCGYMARIAFVLDRIFRKFGLSGKSFIPMLIGTGCGIPGIMASRTIENEYETYAKEINIEAKAMIDIATKQIIPAVIRYTTTLAQSINAVKAACGADISVQTEILMEVSDLLADTKNALSKLEEVTAQGAAMAQGREQAVFYRDEVMTAMKALRTPVDKLEMLVDKSMWPMPSYGDLMFEV